MSPTIRHKDKYFHSTVQGAKDRRQKFHFCRLPSDVRPRNVKLNLSNISIYTTIHVASYLVTCGFVKTNIYQVFMAICKE